MKTTRELFFFRPETSSYQSKDFRSNEEKAFASNFQIKPLSEIEISKPSNLKDNSIIFVSTSYTDIKKYEPIFSKIALWIHPNSGYDNLTSKFVSEANFPIIIGNEIRRDAVFMYIVSCLTKIFGDIPFTKQWDKKRAFPREQFNKHHILIIGHGHIGQKVSAFLDLCSIPYEIFDPYSKENHKNKITSIDYNKYQTVIFSCGLNKHSKNLMTLENLNTITRGLNIINPARGELLKNEFILKYKEQFPDQKVFIDVFEKEPCDLSIFDKINHLYLSSHIAGVYDNIDAAIIDFEQYVTDNFLTMDKESFEDFFHMSRLQNKIIDGELI